MMQPVPQLKNQVFYSRSAGWEKRKGEERVILIRNGFIRRTLFGKVTMYSLWLERWKCDLHACLVEGGEKEGRKKTGKFCRFALNTPARVSAGSARPRGTAGGVPRRRGRKRGEKEEGREEAYGKVPSALFSLPFRELIAFDWMIIVSSTSAFIAAREKGGERGKGDGAP